MGIFKDKKYLQAFRENGKVINEIREALVNLAQKVDRAEEIDKEAERLILKAGGEPAFKKVEDYHWSTCVCRNDCLVHGIPKGKYEEGDLLTIDLGMFYKNTTTDIATTFVIGKASDFQNTFLNVGRETMKKAIKKALVNNRVKDISQQLQEVPEKAGYSVTRDLVGHGLGKTMHEPPAIPCYISNDPNLAVKLVEGMIITIEAMYMAGDWHLEQAEDGWSLLTRDGSISAMFEEDILITSKGPEVLSINSYA
jgi:methionyl aminopeptidase